MKKVTRAKSCTVKQMSNMACNLQEKFKLASNIEVKCWKFQSGSEETSFSMYVEYFEYSKIYPSWKALQDKYFKLMGN